MQWGDSRHRPGGQPGWPLFCRSAYKARACSTRKVYPDNKVGHWLIILGVLTLFLFSPVWVWVIGLGVALVLLGMIVQGNE